MLGPSSADPAGLEPVAHLSTIFSAVTDAVTGKFELKESWIHAVYRLRFE
jgi:hypothetical protein